MTKFRKKETYEVSFAPAAGTLQYSMGGGIVMPMTYNAGDAMVTAPDGKQSVMPRNIFDDLFEAV